MLVCFQRWLHSATSLTRRKVPTEHQNEADWSDFERDMKMMTPWLCDETADFPGIFSHSRPQVQPQMCTRYLVSILLLLRLYSKFFSPIFKMEKKIYFCSKMSENRKVGDCQQSVYPLGAKMDGDSPKTSENKEKLCFLSNKCEFSGSFTLCCEIFEDRVSPQIHRVCPCLATHLIIAQSIFFNVAFKVFKICHLLISN